MDQPYIFKKQIISIVILLALQFLKIQLQIKNALSYYLLVVIFITFVPSLRKKFKYSIYIHTIIYYFPMILPICIISINISNPRYKMSIFLGVIFSLVLLLSNYKHNRIYLSKKNHAILQPIDKKEFFSEIFDYSFAILSEEVFYRYFIIGLLYDYFGVKAVIFSTILFFHSHYINRWANVIFNTRSYIYHIVTGLLFGLIFIYTKSIVGCLIAHFLFNSPRFIILFFRLKQRKNIDKPLFDDYNL